MGALSAGQGYRRYVRATGDSGRSVSLLESDDFDFSAKEIIESGFGEPLQVGTKRNLLYMQSFDILNNAG